MMTFKRMFFRAGVRILERLTLMQRPKCMCHLPLAPIKEENAVDIITIAFNNAELIPLQERLLHKNIADRYTHIVADNSTDKQVRKQLYQYCLQNGIPYISLPHNWLNIIGSSYSHACALNYVYKHVIRKRQPYAFGQIDHDILPVCRLSVLDYLRNQPIFGPLRQRGECWYLSAIISFFRYEYVRTKKVDFMPVTPYKTYLDSGGGNWYDIYSTLDVDKLAFAEERIESLREGGDRHGDSLEWFDHKKWLHTINGSCWKQTNQGKEDLIRPLLQKYIES